MLRPSSIQRQRQIGNSSRHAACRAAREDRESKAERDLMQHPAAEAAASGDFSAASPRSGEFGDGGANGAEDETLSPEAGAEMLARKGWAALPARYQMVVATSVAFIICNMDKVSTDFWL